MALFESASASHLLSRISRMSNRTAGFKPKTIRETLVSDRLLCPATSAPWAVTRRSNGLLQADSPLVKE
jgi:hypothetical protein